MKFSSCNLIIYSLQLSNINKTKPSNYGLNTALQPMFFTQTNFKNFMLSIPTAGFAY